MRWRRYVVLSLGCIVGLLLYWSWRLLEGGATASIACGGVIAHRLGCSEVTVHSEGAASPTRRSLRELVSTILLPLVARCTSSDGRLMLLRTPRSSPSSEESGRAGADAGVDPLTQFISKPNAN